VIIGTLHQRHHRHPKYDPGVLRDLIVSCQPSAILIESPEDWASARIKQSGLTHGEYPEFWAWTSAADRLGVPLIPYDMAGRNKFYKKTRYFERQRENGRRYATWGEQVRTEAPESLAAAVWELQRYAAGAPEALTSRASPEVINSSALDTVVKIKLELAGRVALELLRKSSEHEKYVAESQFLRNVWRGRNRIMADNILKTAKAYRGKRLVVVTGSYHRYILRELLGREDTVDLKEYWELPDRRQGVGG